ncbi:DASS family sodium-coupled anion symporter [Pseudooceanicola sediminis]|uniref:DASS family sodium-coupled anion symporter n=1 Tax=Pseudooceanicola sediminis TaxID=2211117 RepID=A0A399IYP0_9RHOB|nr:DASS family sodium-coupled anion symporter [Pseudooceanicola sediminis]KAA2315184.1 DASS family sodium-coupled anion symporter [Puniceibacterium sp. HSS470]RII37379.1 DASS family sodium-coupled anion symporter [Pseudooceanicola sediminis]|tara:strand:+ start:267 stop:1778 length:1512 start_codon:yes stop_codon:yes gene_type:complete
MTETSEAGAPDTGATETLSYRMMALGPIVGLLLMWLLPDSLPFAGRAAAGCALWMAIWWMTEAVPIPVTSLLPLVLFPLFGIGTFGQVSAPYANAVVFLVLGGVILGLATERSNLHRRVALRTIQMVGTRPDQIVLGMMIASAFISAWISNTATAVIMVPIGASILKLVRDLDREKGVDRKFAAALMLGIAYGVTIGSTATLVGQPPTALMAAYLMDQQDYLMGFAQWMMIGVPFAVVMLAIAWVLLTKVVYRSDLRELPGGAALIRREVEGLGPMSKAEARVSLIFLGAIFFWVVVPLISKIAFVGDALPFLGGISSSQVAMTAAVACFVVSSGQRDANGRPVALLTWDAARDIPWGLLLLFGGGLSLSAAFTLTGLSGWIGAQVGSLGDMPPLVVLIVAAVVGLGLTELTSNTATAAAFFPIMGSVAVGIGIDPLIMTAVMTLAVCSAYMLPVATPSNAVAFGSGEVSIKQMVRAGVWLNMISLVVIFVLIETLVPMVLTR